MPSSSLEKSLAITERIVNQNTHLDIADDFRFFEDESDEYRDSEGTLLPLWIYNFVQAKKLSVTSTQWSSKYHDLFAVGLGSYNYARQGIGYLLFYSLKNPSYPGKRSTLLIKNKPSGFIFETDVGVMCLDISTAKSHLVAVGLYDGSVAVFNLLKKEEIYRCKTAERHVDPVWAIKWQNDQFCSVSSDGMVKCWNPKTGETKDVITLYDDELAQGAKVVLIFIFWKISECYRHAECPLRFIRTKAQFFLSVLKKVSFTNAQPRTRLNIWAAGRRTVWPSARSNGIPSTKTFSFLRRTTG